MRSGAREINFKIVHIKMTFKVTGESSKKQGGRKMEKKARTDRGMPQCNMGGNGDKNERH